MSVFTGAVQSVDRAALFVFYIYNQTAIVSITKKEFPLPDCFLFTKENVYGIILLSYLTQRFTIKLEG